jgi:hypothetical protein
MRTCVVCDRPADYLFILSIIPLYTMQTGDLDITECKNYLCIDHAADEITVGLLHAGKEKVRP